MSDSAPRSTEEVQAHRGGAAVAPEHTICPSCRAAHAQGALCAVLCDNSSLLPG